MLLTHAVIPRYEMPLNISLQLRGSVRFHLEF